MTPLIATYLLTCRMIADDLLELSNGLRKEMSEVEIEYRDRATTNNNNSKGGRNVRVKSAERKKPVENPRGRPPAPKQNRQKQQQQQKGVCCCLFLSLCASYFCLLFCHCLYLC